MPNTLSQPRVETRPYPYPSFNRPVSPQGYCWWYIDAVSDDHSNMITIIAFVGSVFSPYYKRARKNKTHDPDNHCSINIALYGQKKRWCMTERHHHDTNRQNQSFVIGPSALTFKQTGEETGVLLIDVNEKTVPLPGAVRGRIKVDVTLKQRHQFALDSEGDHIWWPAAPNSRISVELDRPQLNWQGNAYADMNWGNRPVENDIDYWCWSRYRTTHGTHINYDIYHSGSHITNQPDKQLAILIDNNDQLQPVSVQPLHELRRTGWRMQRHAQSDSIEPEIIKTLEDTPFYSRSLLSTSVNQTTVTGIHESVSLTRFKHPVVQAMLHFRMPRVRCRRA